MITEDLVAYIQSQTKKNIPKERIVARLTQAGWHPDDVAEGFAKLAPVNNTIRPATPMTIPTASPTPRPLPLITPVRMPTTPTSTPTEPKVWVPMSVNSLATGGKPLTQEIQKAAQVVTQVELVKEAPKEAPVVHQVIPEFKYEMPAGLSLAYGGRTVTHEEPVAPITPVVPVAQPVVPAVVAQTPPVIAAPIITKPAPTAVVAPVVTTPAVVVPVTAPVHTATSEVSQSKDSLNASISSILDGQKPMTHTVSDDSLSRRAMIASYKDDSLSVNQSMAVSSAHNTKIVKKTVIGLGALVLIGLGVFVFAAGIIKLPNFTAGIVKKDPKEALLEASMKLGSLHYYKSALNVDVASPSFAAITSGLVTGNVAKTGDLETASLDAVGEVSNGGPLSPTLSSYTGTLKSSLLMDDISSSYSYDGSTSYIDVPSLSELFPKLAPPPATVAMQDGQLSLLVPELSQTMQDMIKKYDVFNIVSKGISPYMQTQVAGSFKDFLSTVTVSEKDNDIIHSTPTYHYSFAVTQPATKKLLTDMLDAFVAPLPDDQKASVTQAFGSVSVDSFDVWVGKDDGILRQYDIALSIPLSKVIALDDKGIAGKEVTFHIKDTFYDFDAPNDIHMPATSTSMDSFVKSIRDTKIKGLVYGFIPVAKSLSNAEGGYGKKPNTTDSCTNPVPSSLFSPVGHNAGASNQVGAVASSMSTLMSTTNDTGFCYSTPGAWALAAPLASSPQTYYCADSTGATTILSNALSGTICK